MTADRPLLPAEFEQRILLAERPGVASDALAAEIDRLSGGRHPDVVALDPDAYPVPMAVALHLYRQKAGAPRTLVLSAVGREGSPGFGERLAAAARDAYAAADFVLLGAVGFRAELEHTLAAGGPLLDVFRKLLRPGLVTGANRARFGSGYLRVIPAAFVVPRDLGPPGAAPARKATDWPLLRLVWQMIPEVCAAGPDVPAALAKAPCRFVREAVAGTEWPEVVAPRVRPPRGNPFAGLARGSCRKPPSDEDDADFPPVAGRPLPAILRPPPPPDATAARAPRPGGRWWRFGGDSRSASG